MWCNIDFLLFYTFSKNFNVAAKQSWILEISFPWALLATLFLENIFWWLEIPNWIWEKTMKDKVTQYNFKTDKMHLNINQRVKICQKSLEKQTKTWSSTQKRRINEFGEPRKTWWRKEREKTNLKPREYFLHWNKETNQTNVKSREHFLY